MDMRWPVVAALFGLIGGSAAQAQNVAWVPPDQQRIAIRDNGLAPQQVRFQNGWETADYVPFAWHELDVLDREGVPLAGREIRERHLVAAADAGIHPMDLAGKAVRREPFDERFGIEERLVNAVGGSLQNAVQPDGACLSRHGQ